jgi:hypothetical protein
MFLIRLLETRFKARNVISEPGPQDPHSPHTHRDIFKPPCTVTNMKKTWEAEHLSYNPYNEDTILASRAMQCFI